MVIFQQCENALKIIKTYLEQRRNEINIIFQMILIYLALNQMSILNH